jgi:hypothetical protein
MSAVQCRLFTWSSGSSGLAADLRPVELGHAALDIPIAARDPKLKYSFTN